VFAPFHNRHDTVGGAKVNTDNFSHGTSSPSFRAAKFEETEFFNFHQHQILHYFYGLRISG